MPLAPILMTPAYRCGDATPWGGDGLRRLFGRSIPDGRTGESLEVSAIPGLESRDETGTPLSALIALYGERLTGKGFCRPFPLLLKLLDARDALSVQVHPDDAYAARTEGKLGKTEAWHILHAEPGAELVYSFAPKDQFAALKYARSKNLKILANWHSHPASPSRPSQEDLRLANDPTIRYAILSLLDDEPKLNSFKILNGEVVDKEVHL